jgi:hypothetical protein
MMIGRNSWAFVEKLEILGEIDLLIHYWKVINY